jgi:hypothetical protein
VACVRRCVASPVYGSVLLLLLEGFFFFCGALPLVLVLFCRVVVVVSVSLCNLTCAVFVMFIITISLIAILLADMHEFRILILMEENCINFLL